MSTRSDDSRPSPSEASMRNTARDVPAAKFKELPVGTVAPRGLRGPSLLPGQGAPDRIDPQDVEFAVLRDAETLDGPHVARVAQRRLHEPHSPSPAPVSVEVLRVRSIAPAQSAYASTPPSPSARSIQSGTLISVGSVDPRAPTELSLPSPPTLSVSERAAYMGPEAVVDRTPSTSPRELPRVAESSRFPQDTHRPSAPILESLPNSSQRRAPVGSGAISSARPSPMADSVAPSAQNFRRLPRPYSPVSAPPASVPYSPSEVDASRRSAVGSDADMAPRFQIHSELDALRHDRREDNFDLRSASTQREPLASRKKLPSADWTPHGPPSERAYRESEPNARSSRHGSPVALPLMQAAHDTVPPTTDQVPGSRPGASLPLSWMLAAAAFAVLLALLVAWVLGTPSGQRSDAARAAEGQASVVAPRPVAPPAQGQAPQPVVPRLVNEEQTSAAGRTAPPPRSTKPRTQPSAAVQPAAALPNAADLADAGVAAHRSIY